MPSHPNPDQQPRRSSTRTTKLTANMKISLGIALALGVVLFVERTPDAVAGNDAAAASAAVGPGASVVRDSSHRLSTAADGDVTFVEFLDFECEACGAIYPAVEQLRRIYEGRVTFVIRYFPLPGHFNAERAARAVEAAAQQGKLEPMYRKMYETQKTWGEAKTPKDELFRGFADQLALDMAKFDAAYTSPETLARINVDVADGKALGVTATPTMFLNGERLDPQSYQDLINAFDAALA